MNILKFIKYQVGISLAELVIALIIAVILVALASPGYRHVVLVSHRAEARSALHSTLLQQERYFTQYNTYFEFDSDTPNSPFKWWSGSAVADSHYEIHATACPGKTLVQCVLLTAIPGTDKVQGTGDPVCGNLMLDSAYNKSYSTGSEANFLCW